MESNDNKKRGDAGWYPGGNVGAVDMSRLGGRILEADVDVLSVEVEANGGVRGYAGVGIRSGDIQRDGPPPYNRAIHILRIV